jgi:phosphoribosylanthranilate isomerase
MTWVKICGMTSHEAVSATIAAGADAMGFVLAPNSVRALTLDRARDLATGVEIATFIVTVDLSPGEAIAAAEYVDVTGIQAHGRRSLDVAAEAVEAGYLSIAPIPVGPNGAMVDISEIPRSSLPLFDTASSAAHGGTGVSFDWSTLPSPTRPFILAGGLGPENVAEAIEAVHPFGVDASSKLESEPGVKDMSRIVDFIQEAKMI